jgi:putative redox protein
LVEHVRLAARGHLATPVIVDQPVPDGDDQGLTPMELLLLSVASCGAQTLVRILRKMRQPVEGLEVEATGERRGEHPTIFTRIDVRFTVVGKDVEAQAVEHAIQLGEEQYCPVWAMLRAGTNIVPSYVIVGEQPA